MERRELAALPALVPLLVGGLCGANASAQEAARVEDAERALREYNDAFGSGDTAAVAGHFHYPSMLFGVTQSVTVLNTPADAETNFGNLIRTLRERGYSHSTFAELRTKALGPVTAIASLIAVRHLKTGGELQRVGATYLLRKTDAGWRIAVIAGHPPGDMIRL